MISLGVFERKFFTLVNHSDLGKILTVFTSQNADVFLHCYDVEQA